MFWVLLFPFSFPVLFSLGSSTHSTILSTAAAFGTALPATAFVGMLQPIATPSIGWK